MVKVIVCSDGGEEVLKESDFVIGAVSKDCGESLEVQIFLKGKISNLEIISLLSGLISSGLEHVSDDRLEYIASMIEVYDRLEKKIKEELKAGDVHPLVDKLIKEINEDE